MKHIQMVQVTWPRWLPCPYMIKTFKNLLWNPKADDLETWYTASSTTKYVQMIPWVDLDLFYGKSDLVPYAFVLEKVKNYGFFIIYCSLWYNGRCSQLKRVHEALWVPEVKVIHWPRSKSLRFNNFKLLFLNNTLNLTYPQHSGELDRASGPLVYASWNFGTMNARVMKFHIWVPHGKIADPYFFLFRVMPLFGVTLLL